MKKVVLFILCFIVLGIGIAHAGVFTFTPTPRADLWDLDHWTYYTWGIDWRPESDILSATLTIDGIYEQSQDALNILYVNLLDSAASGVTIGVDNPNLSVNEFSGPGTMLLGAFRDTDPGLPAHDLVYQIPESNFAWLADGNFGFGIDPDCQFNNNGFLVTVNTAPIPEPATMSLLGMGVLGLFGLKRRKA